MRSCSDGDVSVYSDTNALLEVMSMLMMVEAGDWCLQDGLSNEAFEDNFVPNVPQFTASEVRDVFRERDELRTQLECATDELRQYKPEFVDPSCCVACFSVFCSIRPSFRLSFLAAFFT